MSTTLFIIKTLVELIVGVAAVRILFTVFGNDHSDESKGPIGWIYAVIDNPMDYIKPLTICALVGGGSYMLGDFLLNSTSVTAALCYEIMLLFWPIVKWVFIVFTTVYLNYFVWLFFFRPDSADSFIESHAWLGFGFSFATGARSPVVGTCAFLIVNGLLAWGIYYQLPEAAREVVHSFLIS